MKFLLDEMYGERVAELLGERGHDAAHVRSIGLGGAPDAYVLARAVDEGRIVVTENASDFLPLLDQRQSAGVPTTPVLIALTAGRGVGGALHARLADDIDSWAADNGDPYTHAHWLPGAITGCADRARSSSRLQLAQ
jgi:predicted nuclease of predicted toxin-antitoxin system